MRRKLLTMTAVALLLITTPALAGKVRRQCQGTTRPTSTVTYYTANYNTARPLTYATPRQEPVYATPGAPQTMGQSRSLLGAINAVRARYGLRALAHDANLTAWAANNSAHCHRAGLGHWQQSPGSSQVVAMGSAAMAVNQWLASPPHAAIILSPSASAVGIASSGQFTTANIR